MQEDSKSISELQTHVVGEGYSTRWQKSFENAILQTNKKEMQVVLLMRLD